MRTSRVAGLLFLATATLAQQQQPVEITSEPSHHLVFENEYVRVFDVTVAPKATTLVHRHGHDYLFVTLGDTDVVNTRVGEKPVPLHLNDGEVRYTAGNFAHSAVNESAHPFHNITIELLKPSSSVKTCTEGCEVPNGCAGATLASPPGCPTTIRRIASDQWTASLVTLPPSAHMEKHTHTMPHMVVAVTDLDLSSQAESATASIRKSPGGLAWVPSGVTHSLANNSSRPAQFVILEFKPEKQNQ
jgi:quercetin dioxygenase-like cupin family protein